MTRARTHAHSRLLVGFLAIVAMACAASPAAAATGAGFGVSPMKFDIDVTPGKSATHQITLTNTDDVATRFTFSKEDYQGDKDEPAATPVMLGGKFASDISGYDWISAPEPVTVPAGESRTVDVRVSAPAGATGGHYAALIVSGAAARAGQLVVQSRLGVLFLMNAGGVPPPDIVITEVREVGPTKTVTKIKFVNEGRVHTTPNPVVTVRDPITGKPIRRATGSCSTAPPGGAGECVVDERDGTTVGESGVTSGAEQKQVDLIGEDEGTSAKAELPTEWAGAWTSMLLPLVGIVLFVLYFLFLRRRRRDEDGAELALS